MDDIHIVLSDNLKALRAQKRLSLDKVAELTGVSKTMLGQIERGESNPTIQTVWKIANGLKTSFTALISRPQPDTLLIAKQDVPPVLENGGTYRAYPFFPFDENRRFEMYSVEIDTEGFSVAAPHRDGTEEFITVFEGELTVRVNDEEYTVRTDDSIRFRADRPHAYLNSGPGTVRMSLVIHYPD